MTDRSKIPENNDEGWDTYKVADLYAGGAPWVPVFEALAPKLTGVENLVLGFAIRAASGGRELDMKASEIAKRIGVTRGAVQQSATRLVRLNLLCAEPQRIVRIKIVEGRERVTRERRPTVYTPNVPVIARAVGLPARPASGAGRKAPSRRAPAIAACPDTSAARASEVHPEDAEAAYTRFCSAFPGTPGKMAAETKREWDALIERGYPLDRLAVLGERYMAASLGETEKARYPLTFLRKKDLVRALLGSAPQSDQYLIANWGTPFIANDYWFIKPAPTSGLRANPCLGHIHDLPADPEEVRCVFAAGLANARAKHAPLDSINYPSFAVKTDSPGAKNPA